MQTLQPSPFPLLPGSAGQQNTQQPRPWSQYDGTSGDGARVRLARPGRCVYRALPDSLTSRVKSRQGAAPHVNLIGRYDRRPGTVRLCHCPRSRSDSFRHDAILQIQ